MLFAASDYSFARFRPTCVRELTVENSACNGHLRSRNLAILNFK